MEHFSILTKEDIKAAVLEALSKTHKSQISEPTDPEPHIHGHKEAAKFLGIEVTTFRKLKKSGKIAFYQAGIKFFLRRRSC